MNLHRDCPEAVFVPLYHAGHALGDRSAGLWGGSSDQYLVNRDTDAIDGMGW
jgi:hypothetical protein